jgi:hypothetical protein
MFPVRSAAIQKIRNRADMAESMFVTDDELIDLANDNLEIAYHHCVSAYGDSTFASDFVISGLGANAPSTPTTWPTSYVASAGVMQAIPTRMPLPSDFGRLLRCEWTKGTISTIQAGSGSFYQLSAQPERAWSPMYPIDLQGTVFDSTPRDWHQRSVGYWITTHPGPGMPDTLDPSDPTQTFFISFLPVPHSVVSIHLHYVPLAPSWGSDDSGNIRLPDLAWKYVREATAADLMEKQRSDSTALRANAATYMADLDGAKLHPDFANAPMTVDAYAGRFPHGNSNHTNRGFSW